MANIIDISNMPDIQKTEPNHNIYIPNVGVEGITLPILVKTIKNEIQSTIAKINIYVDLDPDKKGIHMSRLISIMTEAFYSYKSELSFELMKKLCQEVLEKCEAQNARIEIRFPYFIEKNTPTTELLTISKYDVLFRVETRHMIQFAKHNECIKEIMFIPNMEVNCVGTSSCPCSKEISDAGAHNQRSHIKVDCTFDYELGFIYIENLIDIIETSFSCPIFNILKRPDEKFVTEEAYNNSKFVEDIYRHIMYECNKVSLIKHVKIHVSNEESIHQHNAVACIGF